MLRSPARAPIRLPSVLARVHSLSLSLDRLVAQRENLLAAADPSRVRRIMLQGDELAVSSDMIPSDARVADGPAVVGIHAPVTRSKLRRTDEASP